MTKILAHGLMTAFLLLSLSGCASPTILGAPPSSLLIDTPEPQPEGATNADVIRWAADLHCALKMSNADKAALRAWSSALPYKPANAGCLRN